MLSPESAQLLSDSHFHLAANHNRIRITNLQPIKIMWPAISIALGLAAIPLLALGSIKLGILIIVFLFYPLYQLLRDIRQNKVVEFNLENGFLYLENKASKGQKFRFKDIKEIMLSTFDQHNEPNAFKDEIVTRFYYLEMLLNNGERETIFMFKEANEKLLDKLLNEVKKIVDSI